MISTARRVAKVQAYKNSLDTCKNDSFPTQEEKDSLHLFTNHCLLSFQPTTHPSYHSSFHSSADHSFRYSSKFTFQIPTVYFAMAVTQQPGVVLIVNVDGDRDWSSGLMGCFTDCKSCELYNL